MSEHKVRLLKDIIQGHTRPNIADLRVHAVRRGITNPEALWEFFDEVTRRWAIVRAGIFEAD